MSRRRATLRLAVMAVTACMLFAAAPAHAATIRDRQWYLAPMKLQQAHEITRGAGVVVGIVDTPIDASHPDLVGRVLPGKGFASNDPANGWGGGQRALHGTGMAGLIVGEGRGNGGFIGIAPDAKLLPFGTYSSGGEYGPAGIRWLTDNGANVINLSIGAAATPSSDEVAAIQYAISHDVVVVASAGNVEQDGTPVITPAKISGVVAVSGVDSRGDAWTGSSFGPEVGVAAPAVKIPSPAPRDFQASGYGIGDGTSEAAAIVSGVVALIRSKYPELKAPAVIERLIRTARDNGDPGRDPYFGFGTVRPYEALTAKVPIVDKNPLGEPAASPSGEPSKNGKSGEQPEGTKAYLVPIFIGIGVAVLVVVLVIVVLLATRRRRPVPPAAPPGHYPPVPGQYQPPGHHPPGQQHPPNQQHPPGHQYPPTQHRPPPADTH